MFTYPQDECFFAIAKTFLTSIIASSHLPRSQSAAARVRIKGGYSTIFGDSDAFKAFQLGYTAFGQSHPLLCQEAVEHRISYRLPPIGSAIK
jgi:hypothetical protein